MKQIYMDNAATAFPKGKGVAEAVEAYLKETGVNINRGSYEAAYSAAGMVYETREMLCRLFDFEPLPDRAKNVIFTSGITCALNMLIKGLLKDGDHVLVSAMEHNAVMRPLVQLEKAGKITFDRIPCNEKGELLIEKMEGLIKENTKAVLMTHASNICGTLLPLKEAGAIAQSHGLYFIVDSAQTAGVFPISMREMQIDALAFTGHKGLLAPQGIGGFLITDKLAKEVEPLITGGTGSISDTEDTPDFLPDKFEAGTMNLPGVAGLHRALEYLEETGMNKIREKEQALTEQFLMGLKELPGIKIIGKETGENRAAVVSIQCKTMDEAELAYELDSRYHIMTRVGMHCAPNAHKTLKTFPEGTIRFSFGHKNTPQEVETALEALRELT